MTITPALRASARSVYRNLCRASARTFAGDEHVLHAFRKKIRNDALAARGITDPETYEEQSRLGGDIADFLRRNVVQGERVPSSRNDNEAHDTFRLRITKETELGNNDSIKNSPPIEMSSRSIRKRNKDMEARHTSVIGVPPHNNNSFPSLPPSHLPMNFSKLKQAYKGRVVPEVKEEDLEESFVRGSGPGGQSINKTENNVQLLHKPSGIRVSCQETRSLALNRRLARRLLVEKLDKMMNPGLSKDDFQRAKQRERERRRRKKAKKRALEKSNEDEVSTVTLY